MTREEAYYHKILLTTGYLDEFDNWFNDHLEAENPLSDIVLRLAECGSDTNRIISCLGEYCRETAFDQSITREMLRVFVKDAYNSHKMSKEQAVRALYNFGYRTSWFDMISMLDYYDLAVDGVADMEKFDKVFKEYLENGIPVRFEMLFGDIGRSPNA